MNIRMAQESDLISIVEIYNQAIDKPFCTADIEHVTVRQKRQWFLNHASGRYPIFVYEHTTGIGGWCSLSSHRPGRKALQYIAEISYYTHNCYRKQGIAKQLIAYTLAKAASLGFRHLFAILLDKNILSIQLLEKFNFKQWGHLPDIADFNGIICGQFIYGKKL